MYGLSYDLDSANDLLTVMAPCTEVLVANGDEGLAQFGGTSDANSAPGEDRFLLGQTVTLA